LGRKGLFDSKINHLETNNKKKNIRDLCGGLNEVKKRYKHRIDSWNDENVDQIPTIFIKNSLKTLIILDVRQQWIV
jgi:hypothetical protein